MTTTKTGTREWSEHSVNCATGCRHSCLYCYARWREVERFRRVKPGRWEHESIRPAAVLARYPKYSGVVMFPTSHDITPPIGGGSPSDGPDSIGTLDASVVVLRKLLDAGNRVLVVSKPHRQCIETLCDVLKDFRGTPLIPTTQMAEFRFSVTTLSAERASFWEPGAPLPAERLDCLAFADAAGYRTSVSCEPLLDCHPADAAELVRQVYDNCSGEVWIGCMNDISRRTAWATTRGTGEGYGKWRVRCDTLVSEIERLTAGYHVDNLRAIYEALRHHGRIRWKDSVQKTLHLAGPAG